MTQSPYGAEKPPTSLRDALARYADVARSRHSTDASEYSRGLLSVVGQVEDTLRETTRDELLHEVVVLVVSDAESRSAYRTTPFWAGVAGVAGDLDLALAGWPTREAQVPDAWSALAFEAATRHLGPPSV